MIARCVFVAAALLAAATFGSTASAQGGFAPAAPGLPTFAIRDYLRLYLGKMPIDLYYFGRGHTDGDIVIHLPTERIVVMGDLFAIWGPYMHLVHYAGGGSIRDWSRSLERALRLDFDTVIPGHSGLTDRA